MYARYGCSAKHLGRGQDISVIVELQEAQFFQLLFRKHKVGVKAADSLCMPIAS